MARRDIRKTEILGQVMIDSIQAMGRSVRPILAQHGADTLDPNAWYSQQTWLEILKAVSQEARIDLMAVGNRVAASLELPDGTFSLQSVLDFIHQRYQKTHRNSAEPLHFSVEVIDDRTMRIIDHSPYPDDLQYGLIYGIFARLTPYGANLRVRYDEKAARRSDGADESVYLVTW